jgi:tRNA threonylcarbamoyl adenosine modification protein YjeE
MSAAERMMASAPELLLAVADDEPSTRALAAELGGVCRQGDCLLLIGDLGAGKTTFARGLIRGACPDAGEVVSPTFNLVQTYDSAQGFTLWHFDLYRLKHAGELDEIGLDEALESGLCLIEWPQLAQQRLPESALAITIYPGTHPASRHIELRGWPQYWLDRLQTVQGLTQKDTK